MSAELIPPYVRRVLDMVANAPGPWQWHTPEPRQQRRGPSTTVPAGPMIRHAEMQHGGYPCCPLAVAFHFRKGRTPANDEFDTFAQLGLLSLDVADIASAADIKPRYDGEGRPIVTAILDVEHRPDRDNRRFAIRAALLEACKLEEPL